METFIGQLVKEIMSQHSDLKDVCIVFPTRRAGLFFQKEISLAVKTPIWSPAVFSIQDYLLKLSGRKIPDQLTLLFELYEVYKTYFPAEDFARFYAWGELMLKDFDDIDKYMIDAGKVFAIVTDMHQIDRDFPLPEEDIERLRVFWKNFFDRDPSRLRNEFLSTWNFLSRIYFSFKERLEVKNIAYEGMAYRELAMKMKSGDYSFSQEYSHIIFAGFYALSPSEQTVLKFLIDSGKASIYWDADVYYADDPSQEAGKFFRNNKLTSAEYKWKQEHFKNINKKIEFAGVPLMVGQAKYAGEVLTTLMKEENFVSERTAVVLPDEKLLFPVLYSLPENLQDINVTMGYPLQQTPLFNLFESLMIFQKNARVDKKGEEFFYFRDILNIVNHPYVRLFADKEIRAWLAGLGDNNFIRMPGTRITEGKSGGFFKEIFVRLKSVDEAFEWYRKILKLILEGMKGQDFRFHRLESEFVYHFYVHLRRLEDILEDSTIISDIETFWKIFKEIISSVRIPFTGEPLKGLQVMGFLETRVLDFDNVIILSVNEDVLPAAGNQPSFIPFNIRKAFGLPTYEEQHAVSAFHFYRLMQRAKRIYLIHNTEAKALTTGERSRFMLQIEYELKRRYPESIEISRKVISTKVQKENIEEVVVKKSAAVMEELSRYVSDGKKNPKSLSASALISYISCPLRFYFRYVAGLAEKEEMEESMEAATFGKVLHKAMHHLYTNVSEINESVIKELKLKINDLVDTAIHEEFIAVNQLEGKNILLRNVIRELVSRIINSERAHVPFNILQLEKDVSSLFEIEKNKFVNLYGIIDRVDQKDDFIRIVDYKTGRVVKKRPGSLDDYFSDPAMKEQFQAMYYGYLTHKKMPGKPVKSGLLIMREMSEGIWFLNNDQPFTDEQFSEFEMLLKKLLNEIFSPAVSFTQTRDENNCKYCAYKDVCKRG